MTYNLGMLIESCVSVLLLVTIGFCFVLNRRLQRMRADELTMKATISELITATEIAERAIAGLKTTVRECDESLGENLRTAQTVSKDISRRIEGGQELLARIARIVLAASSVKEGRGEGARPAATEAPRAPRTAPRDAHAVARAANAFAERTRMRIDSEAA